jgi:hypothetical protein
VRARVGYPLRTAFAQQTRMRFSFDINPSPLLLGI